MTYVFPHVPKCGGTSMLKHLQQSGLKVHFDYEAWNGPRAEELTKECATRDFSEFDVIYGHFPIGRYQGTQFNYIGLVRDPMDRCLSSYKFHKDFALKHPQENDLYSRIGRWIGRGELSFFEYVLIAPNMRQVYKHFMAYEPREKFSLIGTTEEYDVFLERLSVLLNCSFKNTLRERESSDRMQVPEADKTRVRQLLVDEYRWYNRFTESPTMLRD